MTITTSKPVSVVSRDLQEFEAKALDLAINASDADKELAESIVDNPTITTVETITPTVAACLFVELNKHNRDFSLAKAHAYAHQMNLGYWRLHHQGLAFYPNRKLADGQHRLAAVILSGTSQPFTVFRQFSDDALEAIDTAKRRTAGDAFGITGLVQKDDAKVTGSVVERVMKYEHRRIYAKSISPSIYEMKDWAKDNIDHIKTALVITEALSKGDPVLSRAELGSAALGMLIGGYQPGFIREYLGGIMGGVGTYTDSPTVDLFKQFNKSKISPKGKLNAEEKLALTFKGARIFAAHQTTGGLKWKAGKEPLPAPMPTDCDELATATMPVEHAHDEAEVYETA